MMSRQFTSPIAHRLQRSFAAAAPPITRRIVVTPTAIHRRSFTALTTIPKKEGKSLNLVLKAGLPFVLFSVLASWVVSSALDGKLKEQEASQGKTSLSLRQAKLQEEHDEMMGRLNKIVQADFDNTKRIKRPQEILEERRLERERRNKWYRRWWRAISERFQK